MSEAASKPGRVVHSSGKQQSRAKAWLAIYNLVQTVGWAWACSLTLAALLSGQSVWELAGRSVQLCQGAAFLEVLHAATGVVRGSPVAAFLQWIGRGNALFALLSFIPEVQKGLGVSLIFLAWTLVEVVRYPWYLSVLLDAPNKTLTWLRYTAFIPLFPIGVIGEFLVSVNALPYIKQRRLHTISMPNAANFAFDYHWFCKVGLFILPLAFLFLYTYMLRQRKAKLGPRKAAGASQR